MVKSVLNSFIISRILRKSRRKNEQFEGKIDHFRSFFSLFQPFSGTWSLRRIIALTGTVSVSSLPAFSRPLLPTLPWSLGPCRGPSDRSTSPGRLGSLVSAFCGLYSLFPVPGSLGLGSMHRVWTRYGKGMSPSVNPLLSNMEVWHTGGRGGGSQKINKQRAMSQTIRNF